MRCEIKLRLALLVASLCLPASGESPAAVIEERGAILIAGIDEPAEMRVAPRPIIVPSEPEKMLAAETRGHMSDQSVMLPALNRVLARFPDYSDGYVMRAGFLCSGDDRAAILVDINNALRHVENLSIGKTAAGLFSMRAKLEHLDGNDGDALADLEKSITTDLTGADKFVNSRATGPEKTAGTCTWTENDMNALVQRFPLDYRTYLMRGLYFSFFIRFNDDETLRKRALDEFKKATEAKPDSPLPHYFAAAALLKWAFAKQASMSDQQRKDFYRVPLDELNEALTLNPRLLPALSERANIYLTLKRFEDAIADYDRYLNIDPNDASALDGRGHAELGLGKMAAAIVDFGETIRVQKGEEAAEYETRADAYMKTGQWDLAIKDLTAAISLEVGKQTMLMNIRQFRTLYPEYNKASDEEIARKLNQTFWPNINSEVFSQSFLRTNNGWPIDVHIYLDRSNAYLGAGDWHDAAVDFRRAIRGAPTQPAALINLLRWGDITPAHTNGRVYLDMETFDGDRLESAKIWIKQVEDSGDTPVPFSLVQYELNCSARRIRGLAAVEYDASGTLKGSSEGSPWKSVIPDTLGETMLNGVCRVR